MTASWMYSWELWASLGSGVSVGGLVLALGKYFRLGWWRPPPAPPREEDLPWADLLELFKQRRKENPGDKVSTDELLDSLLAEIGDTAPNGADWTSSPADDRRKTRRRWSNPIEVVLCSPFHNKMLHGLVINRSTGGLAILTDVPFEPDTVVGVRAIDAPSGVGFIDLCVRHSREVSKLWLIGCQYKDEIPWKAKVWFG